MRLTQYFQLLLVVMIFMTTSLVSANEKTDNIVIFMDNSGSIRQYEKLFHQQIRAIYKMAKGKKQITFIPIGKPPIQIAHNRMDAQKIFTFASSYTYIADTLESAEKKGLVGFKKQTIVFISDMESDLENTPLPDYQLLSVDYKDTLRWYNTLIQWIQKGVNLHIILLTKSEMPKSASKDLDRHKIEAELNQLVKNAEKHEEYVRDIKTQDSNPNRPKTSRYIRTPEYNQELIARVIDSLPLIQNPHDVESTMHLETVTFDNKEEIMSIMEGIIQPGLIKKFNVKIEIDRNVVDFELDGQRFVKNQLQKRLKAISLINNNPQRQAVYQFYNVNDLQKQHDDNYHYHYRFMRGTIQGKVNLFLTNKMSTRDGILKSVKEKNRSKMDIPYNNLYDLIDTIYKEMDNIKQYQIKDFPIGEKKILFTINSPIKHLLKGQRLTASVDFKPFISGRKKQRTNLSTRIDDDGSCFLMVREQSDSRILLVLVTYENNISNRITTPIHKITADEVDSGQPIEINNIPINLERTVNLDIENKTPALKGNIRIVPYDYSEYFEILNIAFPTSRPSVNLMQGSYYYTIIFDYSQNTCLNTWMVPFHVVENKSFPITVQCMPDLFAEKKNAFTEFNALISDIKKSLDPKEPPPKLGGNEIGGKYEEHLTGSPLFFRRLLQYTDNAPPNQQHEIKDLWRRVHYQLFVDSKMGRNIIHKILEPALINLNFTQPGDQYPIKRAIDYLKIMLEKYFQSDTRVRLSPDEREIYNYELLETMKADLSLSERFIQKLRF